MSIRQMYRKSRKQWIAQAEQLALQRTRHLSAPEQNEFWLKYNRLFLPYSNLRAVIEFCGETVIESEYDPYVCTQCDSEHLMEDEGHNDTICTECGLVQPYPVTSVKTRILEGQSYIRKKGYTPEDHMASILTEMQCGRSRDMEDILEHIGGYLKEQKKPVTFMNVRNCLRHLGYKQHYLMIPSILHGLDRHQFKPWVLEQGCLKNVQALFFQYKQIYQRVEKENRKNSLNYHYLLVQFCKMLNVQDVPTRFLRMPQGQKSIQQHDRLWKKILPHLVLYQ
jgi:Poxvirus Late Transcription Factor VLTF3 like